MAKPTFSDARFQAWIAAHGGPAGVPGYKVSESAAPPPTDEEKLDPNYKEGAKLTVHTWTAKNGDVLSLADNPNAKEGEEYLFLNDDPKTPTTSATSQSKSPEEKDENGKRYRWQPNPGGPDAGGEWVYVGPAPPNAAERAAQAQAESTAARKAQNDLEAQRLGQTAIDNAESRKIQQGQLGVSQANQTLNENKFAEDKKSTEFSQGAKVGELTGVYNGEKTLAGQQFDLTKAQNEATNKREDLKLQIQMHQVTAEEAAQDYKRWYDQNITIPLAKAQESRLAADTQLQYEKALDTQSQFAATNAVSRNQVALGAGQNAAENEIKLLPYRAGPNFSSHMSDAINSVAQGSSAGVHFSGDDFTFQAPNLQKIAAKATAQALAHISPYAKSQLNAPQIAGLSLPDFGTAPQPSRYIPPPGYGNGQTPGQTVAPAAPELAPPTMEEDPNQAAA